MRSPEVAVMAYLIQHAEVARVHIYMWAKRDEAFSSHVISSAFPKRRERSAVIEDYIWELPLSIPQG